MQPKFRMLWGGLAAFALAGLMVLMSPSIVGAVPDEIPPEESPCFDLVGSLDLPRNENKVSLCHFTGSPNVVLNEPSLSAWATHTGHHGDCWKFFDGTTGCAGGPGE